MHFYIVLDTDLFRVLSGNQWTFENSTVQRILLNYLKIFIHAQYHRYGCIEINIECSTFPSIIVLLNGISYWMQLLCTPCMSSSV